MSEDLMFLKSGTDIRGVAVRVSENEPETLTNDVIQKIVIGFGFWLSENMGKDFKELSVAVGHDSRISAGRIKLALIKTLSKMGIKIFDCGLASTPAMFMTTIDLHCDAAIEITASHHPFNKNGLKFFTKDGGLEGKDIEQILRYASEKNFSEDCFSPNVEQINYMSQYEKRLRDFICQEIGAADYAHPLKGFKIVVDAGNGAGGFYAENVLKPLGADINGSQFLEPDGMFPNHIPNPEDKAAMKYIIEATVKNQADLGIIFDTDVDRAGAVASSGEPINRNSLIAVAASIALEGNEGGTIVTDSITSDGLKEYIQTTLGGKHKRFKRGYKNVINEAKRLNDMGINCPLAIETSGHAAMRENYFLDDGAYLVTKIIIKMVKMKLRGERFESIVENLKKPLESQEYRLNIKCDNFKDYGNKIIKELTDYAKTQKNWKIADDNYEGVRVAVDNDSEDGWLLLRLSVHDPVMPLNIESNVRGGNDKILNQLKKFLNGYKDLDLSAIEK